MTWLKGNIGGTVAKLLQTVAAGAVSAQVKRITGDPRLPVLLDREARREADRWMTEELGLPVQTRYRDVYQWVDEFFVEFYAVSQNQEKKWCDHWWEHPSAVRRLTMMWASWEQHRVQHPATGEEIWTRVVGDYHFRWLIGSTGPFSKCAAKHTVLEPLESAPMGSGLDEHGDAFPASAAGSPAASISGSGADRKSRLDALRERVGSAHRSTTGSGGSQMNRQQDGRQ